MNSTADFSRRRYEQYKRVIELEQATQHISPPSDLEHNKWGRIKWYYKQYGMFYSVAHHRVGSIYNPIFVVKQVTFLVEVFSHQVYGTSMT